MSKKKLETTTPVEEIKEEETMPEEAEITPAEPDTDSAEEPKKKKFPKLAVAIGVGIGVIAALGGMALACLRGGSDDSDEDTDDYNGDEDSEDEDESSDEITEEEYPGD